MSLAYLEDWTFDYFESDIRERGYFVADGAYSPLERSRNPVNMCERSHAGWWDGHRKDEWELLPGLVSLVWLRDSR